MFRRAKEFLFTALLLVSAHATAETTSLGTWLERDVVPKLADVLTNHPRFRGETIRLATFRDGRPSMGSTELTDGVRRKLRQDLITHQGVRITTSELSQCRRAATTYVLGVEVMRSTGQNHRVDIAVLDTAESVWVGGVSYTWRGRLSKVEKDSFARRTQRSTLGSFDNPLDLQYADQVVESLLVQIQCQTVHLGSVYIASAEQPILARIRGQLIDALQLRSLVQVSFDEVDADAQLMLTLEPVDDRHRLVVKTVSAENRAFERASLYVRAPKPVEFEPARSGIAEKPGASENAVANVDPDADLEERSTPGRPSVDQHGPAIADRRTRPDQRTSSFAARDARRESDSFAFADFDTVEPEPPHRFRYDPLDEPIGKLREKGTCRGTSGRRCSAIELDVHESVRVLTFHTRDGALRASCDARHAPLSRKAREYEVQSLPGTRLSFYAVATRSAFLAHQLGQFVRHAPGSCRATDRPALWLARFDEFLSANDDAIFWRQIDIEKY